MLFVTYTLLFLYAAPVFVLLLAFFMSDGFRLASDWLEFSVSLSGIYFTETRNSLATFVVPFVTAYSTGRLSAERGMNRGAVTLFMVLVCLFCLSILAYSLVSMHIDKFVANLSEDSSTLLRDAERKLLDVAAAYVKETLAYISLLLGVAQSTRKNAE